MKASDIGVLNFIQASAPTNTNEQEFVFGRMGGIARYLYENLPNYETAGYVVFFLVFILSAIVYRLGFARGEKLGLARNIVIYVFLFLGCIILTFLALFLPMIEGLIVAALILIVYKARRWREKNEEEGSATKN